MSNVPFAAQMEELAAYMASKISVPTIGIGGGYAPIGTIISYMGTTAPQDYLACDGSTKNIADYPQLAEFFESQFGSKNYFGGNGTTTFAVPDLRGEFLRGTGTNSHTNQGSGASVGIHQNGTEILRQWYTTGNSNTEIKDLIGVIQSTNYRTTKNPDSVIIPTNDNITKRIAHYSPSSLDDGDNTYESHYTTRPTNTSILYCIKAVVAGEVYSTEERVVGTWIDGQKIYQKTVNFGQLPDNSTKEVAHGIENIDRVIDISGYAYCPSTFSEEAPFTWPIPGFVVNPNGNMEMITIARNHNYIRITAYADHSMYTECYITLKYTKTT